MRISYWSSDVCSSDLFTNQTEQPPLAENDLYPGTDAPLTGRQAEQPDVPHTDNNTDKPDANEPDAGKGSGTTNQGLIPATDTDEEIYALTAASEGRYPHAEERVLVKRIENLPETRWPVRSEEHTSELQSLMRISYAVFCLK